MTVVSTNHDLGSHVLDCTAKTVRPLFCLRGKELSEEKIHENLFNIQLVRFSNIIIYNLHLLELKRLLTYVLIE